eukprot:1152078-Pelagomonas_calceolata.AAC.2
MKRKRRAGIHGALYELFTLNITHILLTPSDALSNHPAVAFHASPSEQTPFAPVLGCTAGGPA